jgi:hypothetical protein
MGAGVDESPEEEVTESISESESVETPVEEKSETDSVENPDIAQPNA